MFAYEPQPGALAKVALKQRAGIHVPEGARALAGQRLDTLRQLAKRLAKRVVVIVVAGVPRDDSPVGGLLFLRPTPVTCGERDDRTRVLKHQLRINPLVRVALQPTHRAVALILQPVEKMIRTLGWLGGGDPAIVESQFQCALADRRLHHARAPTVPRYWLRINWATSLAERYSVFTSMSARP